VGPGGTVQHAPGLVSDTIARGGFLLTATEEKHYLFKNPCTEVWDETKQGIGSPWHNIVLAAIQSHPAMHCRNHKNGCLPHQHGTRENLQMCLNRKGTGQPPPDGYRHSRPELTSSLPGMPPVTPCDNEGVACFQINSQLPGNVYSHAPLPCSQCFNLESCAQQSNDDTDYNPEMLTDDGISTGQ